MKLWYEFDKEIRAEQAKSIAAEEAKKASAQEKPLEPEIVEPGNSGFRITRLEISSEFIIRAGSSH